MAYINNIFGLRVVLRKKEQIMKFNLRISCGISFVLATVMFSSTASAREFETQAEWENNRECYLSRRVPATVKYDTMGELVSPSTNEWEGNPYKNGSRVVLKQRDPVYKTTVEVIEPQHHTLVKVKCR